MNFRKNKKIAIVMAIVVLSLALATTSFAADNYKNLKAWFGEIKIFHNNTQVQLKDKPFIVDGTTYLPVRAVSEMLNKEITWDGKNYHIGINDKPDLAYNELLNKFIVQEITVTQLEEKVKDLEAKLKAKEEEKVSTLAELQKKLNKDHARYNSVDFKIELHGTKDKIEVRVYVDSYRYNYGWNTLTSSQKDRYIQNIVDDILKEFKNASVSGYVEDDYNYDYNYGRLTSFTVSSRGVVSLDNRYYDDYYDDYYRGDLGRYLREKFVTSKNGIIDIQVSEGRDSVYLTVDVDRTKWNSNYPTREQELILEDMATHITDRYGYNYKNYYYYSDISGVVRDNIGGSMYFDFYSDGSVRLAY